MLRLRGGEKKMQKKKGLPEPKKSDRHSNNPRIRQGAMRRRDSGAKKIADEEKDPSPLNDQPGKKRRKDRHKINGRLRDGSGHF